MQGVIKTALPSLTTPTRLANERRGKVYLKRRNRSKSSPAANRIATHVSFCWPGIIAINVRKGAGVSCGQPQFLKGRVTKSKGADVCVSSRARAEPQT